MIFTGVLEEEEDVLVNVGLVDKEKAEKNVELKKKKPDYKPYEEEESVDDMVTVRLHLEFQILQMHLNLTWPKTPLILVINQLKSLLCDIFFFLAYIL